MQSKHITNKHKSEILMQIIGKENVYQVSWK